LFEHPIDGGRADSDAVVVDHHECEPTIAFEGKPILVVENLFFIEIIKPPVTGCFSVVCVGFSVPFFPLVELGFTDADPEDESCNRDACPFVPVVDVIDNGIAGIVGNPGVVQSSP
jgi:hypothetical protein